MVSLNSAAVRCTRACTGCRLVLVLYTGIRGVNKIDVSQNYNPFLRVMLRKLTHRLVNTHMCFKFYLTSCLSVIVVIIKKEKNQCVFVKHYPPAATKSKKLFLASRSKSGSQGH